MNVQQFKPWLDLLLLSFIVGRAQAKMNLLMKRVECQNYAPELLQNMSCYTNRSAFFWEVYLTKDLDDLKGHYTVSVKRGTSMHEYLSVKMDYCQALGSLQSHYLLNTFISEIRRVSNFPLACPLKMNKVYYVTEFKINSKIFPSYLPEMDFVSDTQIDHKNKRLLKVIIHGSLVRN